MPSVWSMYSHFPVVCLTPMAIGVSGTVPNRPLDLSCLSKWTASKGLSFALLHCGNSLTRICVCVFGIQDVPRVSTTKFSNMSEPMSYALFSRVIPLQDHWDMMIPLRLPLDPMNSDMKPQRCAEKVALDWVLIENNHHDGPVSSWTYIEMYSNGMKFDVICEVKLFQLLGVESAGQQKIKELQGPLLYPFRCAARELQSRIHKLRIEGKRF